MDAVHRAVGADHERDGLDGAVEALERQGPGDDGFGAEAHVGGSSPSVQRPAVTTLTVSPRGR